MKNVVELRVSPTPWIRHENVHPFEVYGANGEFVADCSTEVDASLVAAAPELYECLREAVVEHCANCGRVCVPERCTIPDGKCIVQKWRKALAKAAGEDGAK